MKAAIKDHHSSSGDLWTQGLMSCSFVSFIFSLQNIIDCWFYVLVFFVPSILQQMVTMYLFYHHLYHSIFMSVNLCISCHAGFLPEEWDTFLVNTLYPSFTPTVGLFLLGAAGYGVIKYLGAGPPKE